MKWLVKKRRCGVLLEIWGLVMGNSGIEVLAAVVEVKGSVKKREREERGLSFDGERFLALMIISRCLQLL